MWKLRTVICILCVGSAVSDQLSLSAGLKTIGEQLANVQIGGSRRADGAADGMKTAVGRLISSIASVEKLDDDSKNLLGQVKTLLDSILASLKSAQEAVKADADAVNGVLDACEQQAHVEQDAAREADYASSRQNHTNCRGEELTDHQEWTDDCAASDNFIHGTTVPTCTLPPGGTRQADMEDWITAFNGLHIWFQSQGDLFGPLKTSCDSSKADYDAKVIECNNLQVTFESDTCNWVNYRRDRCDQQETCYTTAKGLHDDLVERETPISNQRETDAGMIDYVKCLVTELINGATNVADWEAACATTKAGDYSEYNNIWPPVNAMKTCDDVTSFPGVSGWESTEYASWLSGDVVVQNLDVDCSPP